MNPLVSKFLRINLLSWRHLEINSDLLLRSSSALGYEMIANLSCKHNDQRFFILVYAGTVLRIDQLKFGDTFLSFKLQTYVYNAVLFSYFLWYLFFHSSSNKLTLHKILCFLWSGNLLKDVETLDLLLFIIEGNSMFTTIGNSDIVNFTKMEKMAFPSYFLIEGNSMFPMIGNLDIVNFTTMGNMAFPS